MRAAEGETAGWHHQFSVHQSKQTLGDSKRQGSLVCCSLWSCKESDRTDRLDNNNKSEEVCFTQSQVPSAHHSAHRIGHSANT